MAVPSCELQTGRREEETLVELTRDTIATWERRVRQYLPPSEESQNPKHPSSHQEPATLGQGWVIIHPQPTKPQCEGFGLHWLPCTKQEFQKVLFPKTVNLDALFRFPNTQTSANVWGRACTVCNQPHWEKKDCSCLAGKVAVAPHNGEAL